MHSNIKQTPQNKDATREYETTCKTKQVSYRAHSKRSNGSTHMKQDIITICPKQQLGILQAPKQHATGPHQENKRHGHDVQVKHNKT